LCLQCKLDIEYPDELLEFKDNIDASIKPFIEIETKAEESIRLDQSKFGGFPYYPKNVEYPTDSKGQPMFLLAQINLSETPKLEPLPNQGMLQFFISGGTDVYGACFENYTRQDDFKVHYFEEVIEDQNQIITNFGFLPDIESYTLPIEKQSSLSFCLKYAPISVNDFRFETTILGINRDMKYELFKEYQHVYKQYEQLFRSEGHKIGGYPYFTQEDPRLMAAYKYKQFRLLFQMDTDDEVGIMWGDSGVANFFIIEEDLKNKDFSRVLYNWDCC
jgi:uncharacterized protein YwqG